jgi:hypothetical protein
MHIFLVVAEREVPTEFLRVPSRAQYRRRLPVMCSICEGNIAYFLSKVSAVKNPSSRSF